MSVAEDYNDKEELQRILDAHGQQFLGLFDTSALGTKRKTSPGPSRISGKKRKVVASTEEFEEWTGFGGSSSDAELEADDAIEPGEAGHNDIPRQPDVIVFTDVKDKTALAGPTVSKAQLKAFMSSKVSNLGKTIKESGAIDQDDSEEETDISNLQNDALLHHLVHTQLLSGSLNPDLDIKPAKRRKALAGRVLEVAGHVKLGKGEKSVRVAERNHASKRVRDGMLAKQDERNKKALNEAKEVGNYHPALKQLYEDESAKPDKRKRKRERGLRMGVGNFSGGVLKLGRNELETMSRAEGRNRGGRGRGRGGGRGGGRDSGRGRTMGRGRGRGRGRGTG
ncbi:hypothetical protein EUX98_g432 [Antrodiella citrinella]|uniref:Uncharacterized protein n=1 Tax=Antrodiella citrinella TaxID=2447956 RepID=A0A4S4N689_9APHY|nr:hypothetical protein EUX98_g432 [Antrodiella citrinella]